MSDNRSDGRTEAEVDARDQAVLEHADRVVNDMRALRSENRWADKVAAALRERRTA